MVPISNADFPLLLHGKKKHKLSSSCFDVRFGILFPLWTVNFGDVLVWRV